MWNNIIQALKGITITAMPKDGALKIMDYYGSMYRDDWINDNVYIDCLSLANALYNAVQNDFMFPMVAFTWAKQLNEWIIIRMQFALFCNKYSNICGYPRFGAFSEIYE